MHMTRQAGDGGHREGSLEEQVQYNTFVFRNMLPSYFRLPKGSLVMLEQKESGRRPSVRDEQYCFLLFDTCEDRPYAQC